MYIWEREREREKERKRIYVYIYIYIFNLIYQVLLNTILYLMEKGV